ncbi:MAG: hypothetical protein IJP69_00185 [Synergistaceae bacterium]|nr:hypothetical protein [Synergistaceae bacterium]MBR0234403.1 hypothetical protein [Synergistaceae bacterium]MBR0251835.1 hypothetical protein [Synergistaceae bacterium]
MGKTTTSLCIAQELRNRSFNVLLHNVTVRNFTKLKRWNKLPFLIFFAETSWL